MNNRLLLCLVFLLLFDATAFSQDSETLLFGSLQTLFINQKSRITLAIPLPDGTTDISEDRSSFAVQQMDLFLQKNIDDNFTAFVDLEFQLNYASDHRWGSLSLQEAWLNYEYSEALNAKVGMLYPAFNNLNEIKNRLALLPYIFRPGVYERLLSTIYMSEDYLPERAFVQIHGAIPWHDFFIDYATYMGNAEGSYISRSNQYGEPVAMTNSRFEFLTGVDPTNFDLKLFGGRIGLRSRSEKFKAGFSLSHDYDNLNDTTDYPEEYQGLRTPLLGDAERVRLGADVSGRVGPVSFEAEVIKVIYNHDPAERMDVDLGLLFAYTMLGYHVTDRLFVYGILEGGKFTFDRPIVRETITGGASFRLTDDISAKAQYILFRQFMDDGRPLNEVIIRFVFLGFSIVL